MPRVCLAIPRGFWNRVTQTANHHSSEAEATRVEHAHALPLMLCLARQRLFGSTFGACPDVSTATHRRQKQSARVPSGAKESAGAVAASAECSPPGAAQPDMPHCCRGPGQTCYPAGSKRRTTINKQQQQIRRLEATNQRRHDACCSEAQFDPARTLQTATGARLSTRCFSTSIHSSRSIQGLGPRPS